MLPCPSHRQQQLSFASKQLLAQTGSRWPCMTAAADIVFGRS